MPRKYPKYINLSSTNRSDTDESEVDTLGNHLSVILKHLIFIFSILILVSPITAYFLTETFGVIACLALVLITSPMTIIAVKQYREFSFKNIYNSLLYLIKNKWIQCVLISIVNLFILLKVGMQTMIPTLILALIYILSIIISYVFTSLKNINRKKTISFALIPLTLNMMLTLNFFLSFNETNESYAYSHNFEKVKGHSSTSGTTQMSTLITLENNKYENYYGIRIFGSIEDVQRYNKIKYTFRTGVLGIRVLKHYTFY